MTRFSFFLVLCVLFLCLPAAVQAQESSLKIAVIDIQKIFSKSTATKSIKSQVEKERKAFLSEIEKKESDLRAGEKALLEKKKSESENEFLKSRKAFESKLLEANKFAKQNNAALEEAFAKAMATLQRDLFAIVEEIAAESNYTIVFRRSDVFLAAKAVDITEESLARLEKKIKHIQLNVKK